MDEIQKVLMKAGRKDLAQEYYKKTAGFAGLDFSDIKKMFNSTLSKTEKLVDEVTALKRKFSSINDIEKNYPNLNPEFSKKFLNDITFAFEDLNSAIEDNIKEIKKKENNHVYFN